MQYNPFAHLRETKHYPFARMLRTSLKERLADTYFTLNGRKMKNGKNKMGIIDYIFPIPVALEALNKALHKKAKSIPYILLKRWKSAVFWLLAEVVNLIFISPLIMLTNYIKNAVSGLLTLAISPLVVITHMMVWPIKRSLMKKIQDMNVHKAKKSINEDTGLLTYTPSEENRLFKELFFSEKNTRITTDTPPEQNVTSDRSSSIMLKIVETALDPNHKRNETKGYIDINPQNVVPIKALLRTNLYAATANLEKKAEFFNQVENQLHTCLSNNSEKPMSVL